jgi:gamma-glutamylcyclotransferase (GGCT)/AIG2-like uncharacterized protein YtfP
MIAEIFVYGSLRPDASGVMGAGERARLAAEGSLIGRGHVEGLLVDLGEYPGLVVGPGRVQGLVYRLTDPVQSLAWLDAYEGVIGAADDPYRREVVDVALTDGAIRAWTYLYLAPVVDGRLIFNGDWVNPV